MYNRTLTVLATIMLLLGSSVATAAENGSPQTGQAQYNLANPMDPSTWMKHHGGQVRLNPAHPSTWMVFLDPKAHNIAHLTFTNPENYAQFARPQFWLQFANPSNWAAWMNPASYAVMFDPATYMGWMQPGPWMHFIDPGMYTQLMSPGAYAAFMNPVTYMQWFYPGAYAIPPAGSPGDTSASMWFDPNAIMRSLTPATAPKPAGGDTGKQ
jgi:hypothetical protein